MTEIDPIRFAAAVAAVLGASLAAASLRPRWVVRHPRTVLALLLALTALALSALVRVSPPGLRLVIDPSTESLLPRGDPATDAYRSAVLDFGDDEIFVIAMETGDVFRRENLEALRRVHDAISRIDGVQGVGSLAKVTSFGYDREAGWIELRPFLEDIPASAAGLAELRSRALADPLYRRTLVSTDGRTAALDVSFRKMSDGEFIERNLDGQIRAILDAETVPGRRFYVSGRPHIKSVMYHAMVRDLQRLIPLALLVVSAVLLVVSGTVRGVVLPLATVAAAVLWTFGAIAALAEPLTVLTVLLAPTLVAVGSVYGVHVVSRFEEETAAGGEREAVVLRTLEHMIVPVLIAGLTTVVGFGALLLTDVPAVFEIGAFSVLGVASVTLISLTGIPAALALLPLRRGPDGPARSPRLVVTRRVGSWLDAGLERLARTTRRRSGAALGLWGGLTLVALALIPRIVIDTDYLSYFDARAEVRRDFEAVNRLLSGAVPLFVVVRGNEDGYLREPEVLRGIEAAERRIDAIPGVSRTLSLVDWLRLLNRAVEGDDPAEERVPDSRGGVTELLFLIPKGDLSRFATIDHRNANIIVRTGEVGSAAMRRLTDHIETALAEVPLPGAPAVQVTGNAVLLNRAADGVARAQPLTVGAAALTIFLLLAVGLRSLSLGLVAMVPNVVPVLIFFGVLGSGAATLSLPTSLIGSVALGIAIDATAHFLVRYRDERRAGCDPEEAALRCGHHVGRPVAIASAMLFLGFLSVAFSQFTPIREFGWLCAMTMAVCCFSDLVLLPALLLRARI